MISFHISFRFDTGMPPRAIISKITTDSTTGRVFWVQPSGGEVPILRYQVMYKLKSDFRFVFTRGPDVESSSRTAVITNLKPYTEYNIYVVSVLPKQLEVSVGSGMNLIDSPLYRLQTDVDGKKVISLINLLIPVYVANCWNFNSTRIVLPDPCLAWCSVQSRGLLIG